jgi:hypothetical protein
MNTFIKYKLVHLMGGVAGVGKKAFCLKGGWQF